METRVYNTVLTKELRLQFEKAVVKAGGRLKTHKGNSYTVQYDSTTQAEQLPGLLRSYGEPWTDPVEFTGESNGAEYNG